MFGLAHPNGRGLIVRATRFPGEMPSLHNGNGLHHKGAKGTKNNGFE
jgi:hypothetical protein